MSKEQNVVTFGNKRFTISPEMRNAIETEKKIQESRMATAGQKAKEAFKAMKNEVVISKTLLMEMHARINEHDEFIMDSVEVKPHDSIKNNINEILRQQLKCAQDIMRQHAAKKMKVIQDLTGLNFQEEKNVA